MFISLYQLIDILKKSIKKNSFRCCNINLIYEFYKCTIICASLLIAHELKYCIQYIIFSLYDIQIRQKIDCFRVLIQSFFRKCFHFINFYCHWINKNIFTFISFVFLTKNIISNKYLLNITCILQLYINCDQILKNCSVSLQFP